MDKVCAMCGKKLSFLNTCEYEVGGGEKICFGCESKIIKMLDMKDPHQIDESKEKLSAAGNVFASAFLTAKKMKGGDNIKDAIKGGGLKDALKDGAQGKVPLITELFKLKTADEWNKLLSSSEEQREALKAEARQNLPAHYFK